MGEVVTVAALYVEKGGCYYGVPGVDPWPEDRDARLYPGPHPVAAHPPCERWGRYANGGPGYRGSVRPVAGDDGGCFVAALNAVRRWGGVLEQPEGSTAFTAHGIARPPRKGGWIPASDGIGWVCCVEQGHYGHRARKATWLYAVSQSLPELIWGPSNPPPSPNSTAQVLPAGRRATRTGICQRMSRKQRRATPVQFRDDVMLAIARTAGVPR